MNKNDFNAVAATMYTKAKKILGYWTILLESDEGNPKAPVQFKSLSRKQANDWRIANEPSPALNEALGLSVWRNREAMLA